MNWTIPMKLGLAILIPAGIGMVRYKAISTKYYPFIYFIWLGAFVEIFNDLLMLNDIKNTIVSSNIYVLLSALMMVWFFFQVNSAIQSARTFYLLIFAFICAWILETFLYRDINQIGSYYRIFFSFVLVLVSISSLNYLLTTYPGNLIKNGLFWICVGTILYYTIKVLIEAFWLYGLTGSKDYQIQVYRIMSYLGVLTNLIFAFAILWIPRKQPSIPRF